MQNYENLATVIGQMKRAAIDSYMADQGFNRYWYNDTRYAKWGWARHFYTRPGLNGEGGGIPVDTGPFNPDSVAPQFDSIREQIDSSLEKWLDLPDGSACEDPRDAARSATSQLGGEAPGETNTSSSEIAVHNSHVVREMSFIEGNFTTNFMYKYHTQFAFVVEGTTAACALLEMSYGAQRAIWPAARDDLVTLCQAVKSAWEHHAETQAQASIDLTLSILAAAATAATAVLTAGTSAIAVGALTVAGAAATIGGQELAKQVSGAGYQEIFSSFRLSLAQLNAAIREEEQKLQDIVNEVISTMSTDRADFNLAHYSLGDYPYQDGTMAMQRWRSDKVTRSMGDISAVLDSVRSSLDAPPDKNPTPRSSNVGIGVSGVHYAVSNLHYRISTALEKTLAEYERGLDLFNATVEDYFNAEVDNGAEIERLLGVDILNDSIPGVV